MQVVFCGVGEAFDETLPNTSILLRDRNRGSGKRILLDCGFTAAPAYWLTEPEPLELDAVWISHLHGDHFLGLPQLFIRFSEHGRTRPLQVCGPQDTKEKVSLAMELAYPGKWARLGFEVLFREVLPGEGFELAGTEVMALPVEHPVPALGLLLRSSSGTLFYSGDGRVKPEHGSLLAGCRLGIFEAFRMEMITPGHSSAKQVLELARSAEIKKVALVHMQRRERQGQADMIPSYMEKYGVNGFLPDPGHSLEL